MLTLDIARIDCMSGYPRALLHARTTEMFSGKEKNQSFSKKIAVNGFSRRSD